MRALARAVNRPAQLNSMTENNLREQVLLELALDQAAEDELQLLPGDLAGRGGEAHGKAAPALADVARDCAGPDLAFRGELHHRLDEVAQLALVAGPVGVDEDLERFGGDAAELPIVRGGELGDEAAHQQ